MEPFGYPIEFIGLFLSFTIGAVWLDLRAHKNSTSISLKDASLWSIFWIGSAIAFYYYISARYGDEYGSLFLSGYMLEKTLAIDNLVAIMAIFTAFGVHGVVQHKVLYWGIIGALVFRLIFVGTLTAAFHINPYVGLLFSAIVLWTAYLMFKGGGDDDEVDYTNHQVVRIAKWFLNLIPGHIVSVVPKMFGDRFIVKGSEAGQPDVKYLVTPLLICLIAIEGCDIVFSFDSVPAIIAITQEPLLVYSAVMFAVLGLRNLYFVLHALTSYLTRLETFVAIILVYIGGRLALQQAIVLEWVPESWEISHHASLYIVLGLLAAGVIASLIWPEKEDEQDEPKGEAPDIVDADVVIAEVVETEVLRVDITRDEFIEAEVIEAEVVNFTPDYSVEPSETLTIPGDSETIAESEKGTSNSRSDQATSSDSTDSEEQR